MAKFEIVDDSQDLQFRVPMGALELKNPKLPFGMLNPNWSHHPEYNILFLRAQNNYFHQLLMARGHVFLNEIYDQLGFERTPSGAILGWSTKIERQRADFLDYDQDHPAMITFVDPVVILDKI